MSFIAITSKHCPHCRKFKEVFREEIERGEIIALDVEDNPKYMKLAEELNVNAVPTVFAVKELVGEKVCRVEDMKKGERCDESKIERAKLCRVDLEKGEITGECKEVKVDLLAGD